MRGLSLGENISFLLSRMTLLLSFLYTKIFKWYPNQLNTFLTNSETKLFQVLLFLNKLKSSVGRRTSEVLDNVFISRSAHHLPTDSNFRETRHLGLVSLTLVQMSSNPPNMCA